MVTSVFSYIIQQTQLCFVHFSGHHTDGSWVYYKTKHRVLSRRAQLNIVVLLAVSITYSRRPPWPIRSQALQKNLEILYYFQFSLSHGIFAYNSYMFSSIPLFQIIRRFDFFRYIIFATNLDIYII